MRISLNAEDFGTLCICALRYCQGRQTYMPRLVQQIVGSKLKDLSNGTIKVMLDDCDFQARYDLYGDEKIDKSSWIKWREKVQAEYMKRNEQ